MRFVKRFFDRYLDKRKLVTDLIRLLLVFLLGLIWKYFDNIIEFIKTLFGEWVYDAISYKVSIPLSLLILFLILFVLIPFLTRKHFIKTSTRSINDWVTSDNNKNVQKSTWNEIDLKNGKFKKIKLTLKVRSDFMRFGFKLLDKNANIIGQHSVVNRDNNILIHIGKQVGQDKIAFVSFKNGVRDLEDTVITKISKDSIIKLKLKLIDKNNVRFYVNGKLKYTTYIEESIQERLCLMAWGDDQTYDLIAENIKITTIK